MNSILAHFLMVSLVPSGLFAAVTFAEPKSDPASRGFWTEVPAGAVEMTLEDAAKFRDKDIVASGAIDRVFKLNESAFLTVMSKAPRRLLLAQPIDADAGIVTLPLPDGRYVTLRVAETPVMPPALAEKFPLIRTYSAVDIEDSRTTASIEKTLDGWSAMINSPDGTFFVSPLLERDPRLYVSMGKKARVSSAFQCFVREAPTPAAKAEAPRPSVLSFGGTSRIFRLAMAATAEYTNYFRQSGDSDAYAKARALGEINKIVGRLNDVYGRAFAIRFELVDKELELIHTNTNSDGYTNGDDKMLLSQNQHKLDIVPGASNYDIGHVLSTNGGGLADPGACGAKKARGETGLSNPTGDRFIISYVAHEIGHQLGANHTFNGTTDDCGKGSNRHPNMAFEPGSGSTLMAYAFTPPLCGAQNVANESDAYFHAASLVEIVDFLHGLGDCPQLIPNGNRAPRIEAIAPLTIPVSSPFALDATAVDPDADQLDFTFEQFDLGDPSPPDDDRDDVLRPFFRSRLTPSRREFLGTSGSFEFFPARPRAMHFRATVRDNRGGFAFSDTVVSSAGSKAFGITAPAAAAVWKSGANETIRWETAKTDAPPFNVSAVRISISMSGGPFVPLLASTPNDGSETIVAPAATSRAIVRIDAIGGVFFAVSPPFRISP